MAEKKGSKNAIENRGLKSVMTCPKCDSERQPVKMMGIGKARMAYECKCGILDRAGVPVS